MMTDTQFKQLREECAAAGFAVGLAVDDPDSYTTDEMRELVNRSGATNKTVDDALRDDFQSMTPEDQVAMYDLLTKASPELKEYWDEVLFA